MQEKKQKNSNKLTREGALKLIDQKKNYLADLLNNPSFFIEGNIEENNKFKREKFANNLDLSEAKIGFKKFFRSDRNVYEKKYFVFGIKCRIHQNEDNIICGELRYFNSEYNPCLLCKSTWDEKLYSFVKKYNLKRDSLISRMSTSLISLDDLIEELTLKQNLQKKLIKRKAVKRINNPYKGINNIKELLEIKKSTLETLDPRLEKISFLLDNFDFSNAIIEKQNSLNESKVKSQKFVLGLKCNLHPNTYIEKRQLGRLKEGANPCKECKKLINSKNSRGVKRTIWDIESLNKTIEKDKALRKVVNGFDLTDIEIIKLKKGKRKISHVKNILCKEHNQNVEPIIIQHFLQGKIFCPKCKRQGYTSKELKELVFKAHSGAINIIEIGNDILSQSKFECVFCCHTWRTAVNCVIGANSRSPTGCPKCSKLFYRNESNVENTLLEIGFKNISTSGEVINKIINEITSTNNSFIRDVQIKREGKRELRIDYLINNNGNIFALEIDGPQHYGLRFRDLPDQGSNILKNDSEKVNILLNRYKIETSRIPLPIIKTDTALAEEIKRILGGNSRWMGVPKKSWLEPHQKSYD